MAKESGSDQVYQLKITLQRITPPVWRRVQVRSCTLAELHHVIQQCMGWYNCHLHDFDIGGERYGDPLQWESDFEDDLDIGDESKIKLNQLVAQGVKKLTYVYDMGDDWAHVIQIEKVLPADTGVRYPRCIAGKRACPPEDCGGPWGYGDILKAVQDPSHKQHEEQLEWIGGEFDPEAFDLEAVNAKLR
jgi:hypothetical protein